MAGGGVTICSKWVTISVPGRPQTATNTNCWNSDFVRNVSLQVNLTPLATWSWKVNVVVIGGIERGG